MWPFLLHYPVDKIAVVDQASVRACTDLLAAVAPAFCTARLAGRVKLLLAATMPVLSPRTPAGVRVPPAQPATEGGQPVRGRGTVPPEGGGEQAIRRVR